MSVKVISAGISTTIQDLGRPGYYHLGIPMGGAMDRLALRAANLLVGNDEGAACLESVFIGPELEFTQDSQISITGADIPPKVDGEEVDTWTAIDIKAGQVLSFDYLRAGARAYIAFAGGINTKPSLNSRSTYTVGALGGIDGRAIQAGDFLPVGSAGQSSKGGRSLPARLRPSFDVPAQIRVLPGLYWHRITEEAQRNFFDDLWTVAGEADRMGYRFQGGRALQFIDREQPFGAGSDPSNITDACYPYGSIQVPSGTEPIILHRDAVSGGGYFMVGSVISADMDIIAQLQPNTSTQFLKVDMAQALSARAERAAWLGRIREAVG